MKNTICLMVAVLGMMVAFGCGTVKQVDSNAWARDFYNQPNSTPLLELHGAVLTPEVAAVPAVLDETGKVVTVAVAAKPAVYAPMKIVIEGAGELKVSTQLPMKSMMPRDTNVWDGLFDFAKVAAPWIAGAYLLHGNIGNDGGSTSSTHTTNNYAAPPATP